MRFHLLHRSNIVQTRSIFQDLILSQEIRWRGVRKGQKSVLVQNIAETKWILP